MYASALELSSYRQWRSRPLVDESIRYRDGVALFLDQTIPLLGASHSEVVRYRVKTVWRKAECIAELSNGKEVKLQDAWQFIGYTGRDPVRSMLFRGDDTHLEIRIGADGSVGLYSTTVATERRYTGVNGCLITLPLAAV